MLYRCKTCPCYSTKSGYMVCPFFEGRFDQLDTQAVLAAAKRGEPSAQLYLAMCYLSGSRFPVNIRKGRRMLKKMRRKHLLAKGFWGMSYLDPRLPKRKLKKGFDTCHAAAEKLGCHVMEEKISRFYSVGFGTAKNIEKSNEWLVMAANRGNEDALSVVVCLLGGGNIELPPATAERLFQDAVAYGVPNAQDWQQRYYSRQQKVKTATPARASGAAQYSHDTVAQPASGQYVPHANIIQNLQADLSLCCSEAEKNTVLQLYRDRYPNVNFGNTQVDTAGSYEFDNDTYMEILNDIM